MIFDDFEIIDHKEETVARFRIVTEMIKRKSITYPYSYVDMKGGVVILPIIGENIFAIRQYRPTINAWSLELPAGGIEIGETPEDAVKRELIEETGCIAKSILPLGITYASVGCTNEKVHLFAAICDESESKSGEETEIIREEIMTISEFDRAVRSGALVCATNELIWHRYKDRYGYESDQ